MRGRYNTKQKEEILNFLKTAQTAHVTAADICSHFENSDSPIGTATVYRQLDRLIEEGEVGKYIVDTNTPACFEYLGKAQHCLNAVCFHCKCERCGKLIHLDCDELIKVQEHLLGEHGFRLDPRRTVIYGLCEGCRAVEGYGTDSRYTGERTDHSDSDIDESHTGHSTGNSQAMYTREAAERA